MAKQYVDKKAGKKKSAKKVAWILVALGIVFLFVVVKFAISGNLNMSSTGGLPTGDDAYSVAKDFIRSTVRSSNIDFDGSGYKLGKRNDSTYVISSAVELATEGGDKRKTKFKVLMEYKGGKQDEQKNWALLNISEEQ